jgi:hypothetical protein
MEATEDPATAAPAAAPAPEAPAEPPAVKPLTVVSALRPGTSGHDLVVKARTEAAPCRHPEPRSLHARTRRSRAAPQVVEVKPPVSIARPNGSSALIVEAQVADATAAVVLTARNAQGARARQPHGGAECGPGTPKAAPDALRMRSGAAEGGQHLVAEQRHREYVSGDDAACAGPQRHHAAGGRGHGGGAAGACCAEACCNTL